MWVVAFYTCNYKDYAAFWHKESAWKFYESIDKRPGISADEPYFENELGWK